MTQKVPKSCRSNITTLADAYSPSSLPPPGKIPPPPNFYSLLAKIQFLHPPLNKYVQVITYKNVIFSGSHSFTIFVLIS